MLEVYVEEFFDRICVPFIDCQSLNNLEEKYHMIYRLRGIWSRSKHILLAASAAAATDLDLTFGVRTRRLYTELR